MVDIIDPAGVVRSQVVENETGQLRITMNGAENRRTLAGISSQKSSDRASSTWRLRRTTSCDSAEFAGLRFQIPAHLAELLRRRRGALWPRSALTERLKAENILYDRDEHGEYFQLYSGRMARASFSRSSSAAAIADTARRTRFSGLLR
jgi:4-hydroxyphenylpyruvate dioxygenase